MLLLVCWQQLLNNSDTQSLLTILFKVTLVLFFVVLFTRALRSGKHVWPECTYRIYRAPGPGNYRVSPLCRRISIIFSYFLLYPGIFFFFPFPRLCSSHRLLFQKVVRVLSYCAICVWPHLGVTSFFLFCFFIVLISWVAFSLCYRTPYVRILLVCFDSFATLADLAVTVSDSGICVSMMKNQDGLWGCCWFRWVERTV